MPNAVLQVTGTLDSSRRDPSRPSVHWVDWSFLLITAGDSQQIATAKTQSGWIPAQDLAGALDKLDDKGWRVTSVIRDKFDTLPYELLRILLRSNAAS